MGLKDDITNDVDGILSQEWDIRDGTVVPTTESVKLAGGGVKLDAVMLYSDLADSTELVMARDRRVVAKVYKTFLAAASRLIKHNRGAIRSFDGDRVMGVFLGDTKRNDAVTCAMQLDWAFANIVKPKLLAKYADLETSSFKLTYSTGIDRSDILVVRGGVFADNDLLWIGRAANVAAKLSGIREDPTRIFVTKDVYDGLNGIRKYHTKPDGSEIDMWSAFNWFVVPGLKTYYKTTYYMPLK